MVSSSFGWKSGNLVLLVSVIQVVHLGLFMRSYFQFEGTALCQQPNLYPNHMVKVTACVLAHCQWTDNSLASGAMMAWLSMAVGEAVRLAHRHTYLEQYFLHFLKGPLVLVKPDNTPASGVLAFCCFKN